MDAIAALEDLRGALRSVLLPLGTPGAARGRDACERALRRLDDFVLPRASSLDAPLLAVVGGSTGSGKSTLVNALAGARVCASSPLRPTTRRPVLLHRGDDRSHFDSPRVLPGLVRVHRGASDPVAPAGAGSAGELEMRESPELPEGLAILDSPDVDSISDENRALARRLLDAADLWVFVTSAARYADEVPWRLLDEAAVSGITVLVVLDRVAPEAREAVAGDLRALMDRRGLERAPLLVVEETALVDGMLEPGAVAELRARFAEGAASADSRRELARIALTGAVGEVVKLAELLADAIDRASHARAEALTVVDRAEEASLARLRGATADASELRGEVLARWNEAVGAADATRLLSTSFLRARDRFGAWLRGRPAPITPVEDAIEAGLASLVLEELHRADDEARAGWEGPEWTRRLSRSLPRAPIDEVEARALELTRAWQRRLLETVRAEGSDRRARARIAAVGLNAVSVALIIAVFASTGGLTGAEAGIAGASAVLAQKLLETVFGDQAVRAMTEAARKDLEDRMRAALAEQLGPLRRALPQEQSSTALLESIAQVRGSWL